MLAVEVPAENAERLRRELQSRGLLDAGRKPSKREGRVLLPLRSMPPFDPARFGARVRDVAGLEPRGAPGNPREALAVALLEAGIPPELAPTRWERIGDVLVLRIRDEARPRAEEIARVFGRVLRARTVVEDLSGIHGPLRLPDVRVLWGDGTETVHVEGGVRFRLDVARVMFASGNLPERLSIPERVRPGDVVVDGFAGIGYFALPIAAKAEPSAVYACELNPVAYGYLCDNVRLNRLANVVPLLGDCRDTAPRRVADWVLLGHFEGIDYLDVAVRALRGEGTVVVHALAARERIPAEPEARLAAAAANLGAEVLGTTTRRVKSYAPGILHVVVEARVRIPPKGLSGPPSSGVP